LVTTYLGRLKERYLEVKERAPHIDNVAIDQLLSGDLDCSRATNITAFCRDHVHERGKNRGLTHLIKLNVSVRKRNSKQNGTNACLSWKFLPVLVVTT
jgi:hypothetical protein